MRLLITTAFVLALFAFPPLAISDQLDPRLPNLFDRLKAAPSSAVALPVERQIWAIWHEHTDKAVNELMQNGIERMTIGDLRNALAAFNNVVATDPEFAEGWNRRATVHYLMEDYDASLADIVKTLELEPRHFGALSGRGLVYVQKKDLPNALKAFEDALAVYPQMSGPRANADAIRQILQKDI